MSEAEQVVKFCENVEVWEEAEITILEVSYLDGFVKYDLHTKDGNVDVVRPFEDGTFRYFSNSIEQIDLELPTIAKAH